VSRISETFRSLEAKASGAYIPYVCAGDPDIDFTYEMIRRLCKSGADIIELGLPFSDPIADGPTIQGAMLRSLSAGFRIANTYSLLASLRACGVKQPIVVMTYFNPVLKIGIESFCRRLARAGGDAVLVVDLPLEESSKLDNAAERNGLDVIRLIAPTTTDSRMRLLLSRTSGFIYVVSVAGVTGARGDLPESAVSLLRRVTARSKLPVVLGFGISHPNHVRKALSAGASGAVEGSALISIYSKLLDERNEALDLIERHARKMKEATSTKE
jgi:tryptophan synthase alpha chain